MVSSHKAPYLSQRLNEQRITASVDTESNGAKKAFGAAARIEKTQTKTLTTQQRTHLDKIIQRYTQRTKNPKNILNLIALIWQIQELFLALIQR